MPLAFIDWDAAGPVRPLDELAAASWTFVPLAPPGSCDKPDSTPCPTSRPGCGRS
jgi:hypothetical protein